MRVLTDNLGEELQALLKRWSVGRVDIATAWATEGIALDALEGLKERRRKRTEVRTLAGVSGNHTTPDALKRLANLGKVKLVNDRAGLFHVKLVLFRTSRKSLAWVGSANFTGPGFDGNEELIYETEEAEGLAEWFDRRWEAVGPQDDQPEKYCEEWTRPKVPMLGVAAPRRSRSRHTAPSPSARGTDGEPGVIVFVQDRKQERPPEPIPGAAGRRESPHGQITIGNNSYEYKNSVGCLAIVLNELQRRDSKFLERCSTDADFQRRNSRYIAQTKLGLGSLKRSSRQLNSGWHLGGGGAKTKEKWKLILAAARIAGFSVKVDGKMWQAEGGNTGAVKVGF